jgi:hypothetical protein
MAGEITEFLSTLLDDSAALGAHEAPLGGTPLVTSASASTRPAVRGRAQFATDAGRARSSLIFSGPNQPVDRCAAKAEPARDF